MFTGIIQSLGQIVVIHEDQGDKHFAIQTNFKDMSDVAIGDSIACNGVCLTVTSIESDTISVDVSLETLAKTQVGQWQIGTSINLEKSLCLKDKLGGHLVSGHVDAVAQCLAIEASARSTIFHFKIPTELDKYVVKKGSIAVNGVSLTVNSIKNNVFSVNLIPHTLAHTNLGQLQIGSEVNIEIDTIARYVEKMVNPQ
ncbi:MAG TPA: riboflavin synthase [Oceanospirillales bacterium]|nr:riboflavin synthase [Oceanospirillales bacterium]